MTKLKLFVFETYGDYGSIPKGVFAETLEEAKAILKANGDDTYEEQTFEIKKGIVMDFPHYIE